LQESGKAQFRNDNATYHTVILGSVNEIEYPFLKDGRLQEGLDVDLQNIYDCNKAWALLLEIDGPRLSSLRAENYLKCMVNSRINSSKVFSFLWILGKALEVIELRFIRHRSWKMS
jgi:hypothetical protein